MQSIERSPNHGPGGARTQLWKIRSTVRSNIPAMQDEALQENPSQCAAWLAMLSLCLVQFTVQNEDGHLRHTKALQEQPPVPPIHMAISLQSCSRAPFQPVNLNDLALERPCSPNSNQSTRLGILRPSSV